ncbi:hypothetical protein ACGFNU_49875 [Spirillospora sp. NPDC048911]|uniref:hypothetical protein n=1 Tax=Spirillospora sp. NPDC048911 TaxID=3364527 RepID=UPI0037161A74
MQAPGWQQQQGRPPASLSDTLAVAVIELFTDALPDPFTVAAYAARTRRRHELDLARGRVPEHPPVAFYLPPRFTQRYDGFLDKIFEDLCGAYAAELAQVSQQFVITPAPAVLAAEVYERLGTAGISSSWYRRRAPGTPYRIPAGTLARMAIDRWARRPVEQVVLAAVSYATAVHQQPHRTRRDIRA